MQTWSWLYAGIVVATVLGCSESTKTAKPSQGSPTDVGNGSPGGVDAGNEPAFGDNPDTPEFEANFLWQPLSFQDAADLGYTPEQVPVTEQQDPSPVMFAEVSGDVGLQSAVAGGNQHGVGIGFVDIDADGWDDLFVANGAGPSQFNSVLYRNVEGQFTDVSESSGVASVLDGMDTYSIAAADYDADGDVDIYVGAHPSDVLLQNDGNGNFTDVTTDAKAGGPASRRSNTASKIVSFGDFNGDGWMDIASASSEFPGNFKNGYLLLNQQDGTFEDITDASGFEASIEGNPCAVMWSDFDNDGDQDLWIWNDRGAQRENRVLLRNEDGKTFTNITQEAGITQQIGNPMGIDAADINRDGYLDYYVSAIGNNPLYLGGPDSKFNDVAREATTLHEYGWGLGFEDFNSDGFIDLFVAQEDNRPFLAFIHNRSETPTFTRFEMSHHPVLNRGSAHNVAVAFADFDHDGRVDAASAGTDGTRVNLFRNVTDLGSQRWLEVRVPEVPGIGARGGIAARVVVKTGGTVQFRDLSGGSSRASQNAHSVRFGLGQWTGAEWVGALWADGRQVSVVNVQGNQVLELR